jgi:hypothetical protein
LIPVSDAIPISVSGSIPIPAAIRTSARHLLRCPPLKVLVAASGRRSSRRRRRRGP